VGGVALIDRVALVGSGDSGIAISHALDPNVYLLDGGDELALVDAGAGVDTAALLSNVASLGHDPARIRHVLLTHAHADHSGGAAALRSQLGATVYLAEAERSALEAGDEEAVGLDIARRNGYYPADYRLVPCSVDRALEDGDRLPCGDLELEVVATPGHSRGSVCFAVNIAGVPVLFSGDTVFAAGKISLLVCPGSDLLALADSVDRLAGLEVSALLPGHGAFPLTNGGAHIDRARDAFGSMLPPAHILQ